MKNFFVIAFLLAMLAQTFRMGIIEADFFINQSRIAEELCENKEKPELQCEGHCQLKKELEKTDESSEKIRIIEISPFLPATSVHIRAPQIQFVKIRLAHFQSDLLQGHRYDVFHPPVMA